MRSVLVVTSATKTKKTRNRFTGKFIWRCDKCGPDSEYQSTPQQTSSGSECLQACPPGLSLKNQKCVSCGKMYKLKYLATCSRFASDDVCLTRAGSPDASSPEHLDMLIATKKMKVSLAPCVLKKIEMTPNETMASANQMWLKRSYMFELPPPSKNTGVEKPKFKTYYSLTVPVSWLLKTKMIMPTPDYVPVEGQEYCLTGKMDGATGKPTKDLTIQVCEFSKKTSPLRDMQLFKFDTVPCPDNAGSNSFRNMEYIAMKNSKNLLTGNPANWKATITGVNKTDGNRWTAFEEQLMATC